MYLLVGCLLLCAILFAVRFVPVFQRNQALSRRLPVSGNIHWLLGGRAWFIMYQLSRGIPGLQYILHESVVLGQTKGPIYVGFVGWVPFVGLQGGKEIRQVCSASDGISFKKNFGYELSRPFLGNSLLISSGTFWKHQRKLMDPGFSLKSLQRASGIVNSLITTRIDQWKRTNEKNNITINLFDEMVSLTADTIGLYTFSKPFYGDLSKSFQVILSMLGWKIWQDSLVPFWQYVPTLANMRYWYHLYKLKRNISAIISERLELSVEDRNSYNDILSLMIDDGESEVSLKMDVVQLRDELIGLIFAGHDTTASTLSWIFYLLAHHPDIQERVRAEVREILGSDNREPSLGELEKLKYTNAVIKEVLRLNPPATIGRTSLKSVNIGGYDIPKGSELFMNIFAMHRSKSFWGQDVNEFRPDRFLRPLSDVENANYLPFGGVPRACIGMRLAIIEMKIVMWRTLTSFRVKAPSNGKVASLYPSLTLHPVSIFVDLTSQ